MQPWWLNAVCYDNWDVTLAKKGQQIHAAMPYCLSHNGRYSMQPKLTQFLGPYIKYPEDQKYATRLSFEKKTMEQLIQGLPNLAFFKQNFSPTIVNWLPFYWTGFNQTTRYTYIISKLFDSDTVWSEMAGSIRRNIQKAKKMVTVSLSNDIETFYALNKKTFSRQAKKIPYTFALVKAIDTACVENRARKIYMAHDSNGQLHAAIYMVYDSTTAYYLMGGSDPELRSGGTMALLMWNAIQDALQMSLDFNFEGSMIEPIERYFRSFGSVQQQYFTIEKDQRSFPIKFLSCVNKIIRKK
ncbi:MAG: GNAT family N-acetyltransferase [Salinivirgaceae bacterium]